MESNTNPYLKAQQTKDIQSYLNKHGYTDDTGNTLAVDGSYGPKTQQAMQKFSLHQSHMNTPDPETRDMQSLLKGFGYKNADGTPLKIDGIHGPNTDNAINSFENDFLGQVVPNYMPKTIQTNVFPKVPNLSKVSTVSSTGTNMNYMPNTGGTTLSKPASFNATSTLFAPASAKSFNASSTLFAPASEQPTTTTGNYEDALKRTSKPFKNAITMIPGSGQDSGGSTAMINKAFNDYNRNAGLDKSKVMEVASTSNPTNDTAHDKGKDLAIDMYGYGESLPHNAGAGLARDMFGAGSANKEYVTAPIKFDKNNNPTNFGSAGDNHNINDLCEMFDYMDYSQDERWTKNKTDCSSFAVRVYSALGKNIAVDGPDTTAAGIAEWLDENHHSIKKEDLQPGDLIFWKLKGEDYGISHVAIFAGYDENGVPMMWEAAKGGVQYAPVSKQGEPCQYARVP